MIEATAAQRPVHACAIDSVLLTRQSARRMLCAARENPKIYQNAAAKGETGETREPGNGIESPVPRLMRFAG